ncbi:MAG: c(7)-type cytochrome triheme domain-containing protein [Candidatus Methylomirabilia bacterium]
MRFARFGSLALVIGFGIGLLAVPAGDAKLKIPKDFTFEQGKESPGPVTFSHAKHKENVKKCRACHVKVFKMKRGKTKGPFTMARMKEGKLCGTCHNGKTEIGGKVVFAVEAEDSCQNCHKKR